jgi:hypothetical protein
VSASVWGAAWITRSDSDRTRGKNGARARRVVARRPATGPSVMVAAQAFRAVDILGLFVVIVLGLFALWGYRQVGRVIAGFTHAGPPERRDRERERSVERVAQALAFLLAVGAVVMASLTALGVLVPRPGPYPGGAATKAGGIVALIALAVLAARALRERGGI